MDRYSNHTETNLILKDFDHIAEEKNTDSNNCSTHEVKSISAELLWSQLNKTAPLHFPKKLFYLGNLNILRNPLVGIVGTRHPTHYGRRLAAYFAQSLAEAGCCVISGGAIGIDGIANKAALQVGYSAAVIGGGVLTPYPSSNRPLFNQLSLSQNGLLISQFPSEEVAKPWHFPRRNLTLAALCDYVLIIEASLASGSLITAKAAVELGTDVGAIPGSIENPLSEGVNALIAEGAFCVRTPDEVLRRVEQQFRLRLLNFQKTAQSRLNVSSLLF